MNPRSWEVELSEDALRQLERLDRAVSDRITTKLAWLRDHADEVDHQPLRGPLSGLNKLRIGDWRVIYMIDTERHLLAVVGVDHRSEAYRL